MTDVRFACDKCGQPLETDISMAGKTIHCPQCATNIVIPQVSSRSLEGEQHQADLQPKKNSLISEPQIKSPSVFWRRIGAALIDLLLLYVLVFIATTITRTQLLGNFLAWGVFFALWYILHLKKERSVGKAVTVLRTSPKSGADKSSFLLLRFAITWLPLFALDLPQLETMVTPGYASFAFSLICWIALVWYLSLLIAIMFTRGIVGIQDRICKTQTNVGSSELLTTKRKMLIWGCAGVFVIIIIVSASLPNEDTNKREVENTPNVARDELSLTFESLKLTAITVIGGFKENDLIEDDVLTWNATASVISRDGNKIILVSNSHVLGLRELAISDDATDGIPEINQYNLAVIFPTDKQVPVLRFADVAGSRDLSLLEVEATSLTEGIDYLTVPYDKALQLHIGDEVVAVGSPQGLTGTHTFGRISAIREISSGNEMCKMIQTDAAINPGNSGGPLYAKSRNGYKWIGINTIKVDGNDNLGFALSASHIWESKYYWYPATPQGACAAIRQHYQRNAIVE